MQEYQNGNKSQSAMTEDDHTCKSSEVPALTVVRLLSQSTLLPTLAIFNGNSVNVNMADVLLMESREQFPWGGGKKKKKERKSSRHLRGV